jgi:hypothetical protein
MSDAFSLPSNSDDLEQSRNSDYDMFDDEDEEEDNRELNRSSPDDNDLSKWSHKQWYNFFARSMVPNHPLMSNATASVQTLSRAIRAQTRHPAAERFINWIAAEDFGIHGRFNHVFIPNYVYLPKDILTAIGKITLNVTDVHYHLIWQKLYRARQEAAAAYQLQHKELKPSEWIDASPWVNILEDVQVAKPCFTEHLDVLQNKSAIQKTPFATLHGTARSVIYDRFFRPLERLIAIDMPLHERLIKALTSDIETDNLAKIFTKLAGLPGLPDHVRAAFIMENMSTVRHLHSSAFTPLRATQTPPHRMAPRTKVIAGDKQFSLDGNDHLETSELSLDPNEPKTKTFESRYFVAQRNLRENFSAINNIQKRVEQLKLAARTSVSSDDFTKMNIERMKLLDQIGFINIGNIRLMKDLHQLTEQQLNNSKRYEMRSNSMHEIITFQSLRHKEIETLLTQLDDWYEERKTHRLRMKALKKQVDAFQITKSFIPSFDESLRHLELIQAQLDLDKKIEQLSRFIEIAVTVCEQKSDEMDAKSKTKLEKSKKQEMRYIQQEKAASQSSSPTPSTSTGKTRLTDKFKRKQPSSSPDKVQALFRASKCTKMDNSPPKPPPRTATSREANVFSWKTSPVRPHDKSMRPDTPVDKPHTSVNYGNTKRFVSQVSHKVQKYLPMLGRTGDRQPPKEDLTQSEFKEIQRDWTSSESESDKGHDVADDYPLRRPQPSRYSRRPSIESRPAMTLNLADHSSGGQATPTHESITTLPTQGTSNRNFTVAPSNMKRSPRSDNLQALQGNESHFKPIVPPRRTSLTKASTSSTHASTEPTPHWREQLQPVVQFRTHYKFGSHQPPVEINFEQGGTVQPTHTTKTDGRAEYNYPPTQRSRLRQGTSETHEQSEPDGKPTRSGTATRSEVKDRKVYLKTDNAYDCIPRNNGIRRPTSSISGDSDSNDDRMPPLRRQNAIRRRRSPTPARPKSQPGILTTQQERLIALAHGEAKLEPNMRPTSAGGNKYKLPVQPQRPRPEYIETPNTPRPVLQVPLPPKKRFPREMSPNTQRVKPACARRLFPPEEKERDKEEEVPYWNKLPNQPQKDLGQYVPWRGRNPDFAPEWAKGRYCSDDLAILPNQDEKALMTSHNDYKSFPVTGINKESAITLLTVLQTSAPTQIQISEFDLDEESYYYLTLPINRFKQLIEQLKELNRTYTEPQINSVDLAVNTEKSILDETLIWRNSSNKVEDHLDIAIYDKATTAGVERTVSLDYHLGDDSRKSITFPWLHLSRFVYFGHALLEQVESQTCSTIN